MEARDPNLRTKPSRVSRFGGKCDTELELVARTLTDSSSDPLRAIVLRVFVDHYNTHRPHPLVAPDGAGSG